MITAQKKSCELTIGGADRRLVFSMRTLELYMHETGKGFAKDLNTENPFTRLKILFYCGLVIGEKGALPKEFNYQMLEDWIDDCEDTRFDEANQFANEAMGFIMLEEEKAFSRNMGRVKAMGVDTDSVLQKVIQESGLSQKS